MLLAELLLLERTYNQIVEFVFPSWSHSKVSFARMMFFPMDREVNLENLHDWDRSLKASSEC